MKHKLAVYKITLTNDSSRVLDTDSCFNKLARLRRPKEDIVSQGETTMAFWRDIIDLLRKSPSMHKHRGRAITIDSQSSVSSSNVITDGILMDLGDENETSIYGLIYGGVFGEHWTAMDSENKSVRNRISENYALTKPYFFYLSMPWQSNHGYLITYSKGSDKIDPVVIHFLCNKLFTTPDRAFTSAKHSPYAPNSFKEEFKRGATLNTVQFYSEIDNPNFNAPELLNMGVKVTIKIDFDRGIPLDQMESVTNDIGSKSFLGATLGRFTSKKGTVKKIDHTESGRFTIDNSSIDITPKIDVSDIFENEDGSISFDEAIESLRNYCRETILARIRDEEENEN